MGRLIFHSILLIMLSAAIAFFMIVRFIKTDLDNLVDVLVMLFSSIVGAASFWGAFKNTTELIKGLNGDRKTDTLNNNLIGPYDEDTVEGSTRYYIKPKCANMDPAQENELQHAYVGVKESLFKKVDNFLDTENYKRHLLILADSGTGKTSFVLNYYAHNMKRKQSRRHIIALVPLGAKDADSIIKGIKNKRDTAIFLDALDEDVKARDDHRERIMELMELCKDFNRVIVTCRTQFFPKDDDIPNETGIARFGPRKVGEKGTYEFWKLYLLPFDDHDVKRYIRKRFPFWQLSCRNKAQKMVSKIPMLSIRPMLLAHIPDLISQYNEIIYSYQLYDALVEAWFLRESSWVSPDKLASFSTNLAVDIYLNRVTRGTERIPYDSLSSLATKWGIDLQQWQLSGRSLLNRDAGGNYKFSHRSIMEYLFTKRLLGGDKRCLNVALTDQMKSFLMEMCTTFKPNITIIEGIVKNKEVFVTRLENKIYDINEHVDQTWEYCLDNLSSGLAHQYLMNESIYSKNEKFSFNPKGTLLQKTDQYYMYMFHKKYPFIGWQSCQGALEYIAELITNRYFSDKSAKYTIGEKGATADDVDYSAGPIGGTKHHRWFRKKMNLHHIYESADTRQNSEYLANLIKSIGLARTLEMAFINIENNIKIIPEPPGFNRIEVKILIN